jgi:FkbM family methyltransferase
LNDNQPVKTRVDPLSRLSAFVERIRGDPFHIGTVIPLGIFMVIVYSRLRIHVTNGVRPHSIFSPDQFGFVFFKVHPFAMNKVAYTPFKSWAQEYEDVILDYALSGVENGTYIDVGANDPSVISVTKAFYDKNWHGINIEPLYNKYVLLMKHRPRDVNLNIACGANNSVLQIWHAGPGSTMDSTLSMTRGRHSISVQVHPLSDVIANHAISVCHFCKIDVEGFEKQVLLGINWTAFRPWAFCIEATIPTTQILCYDKWEHILFEHGYEFGCSSRINRFYYDRIFHPELRHRFLCQPGSPIPKSALASSLRPFRRYRVRRND